ncbi:MAG: FAD binding domain-containing protein, partial [Planctomycetota bacterium]
MLRLPPFTYHQPGKIDEALRIVAEHGPEAMYVAGGTDLYPNMKRRQQVPSQVVSLAGIEELHGISGDPGSGMRVGAMTSLTEIEENSVIDEAYPGFSEAVQSISTLLPRNMGSVGGNLLLDTR